MAMDMKSFEIQMKARQNAQECVQSLGSFSEWQKDIKNKEQKLIEHNVAQVKEEEDLYTKVRSHSFAKDNKENKEVEPTKPKKNVPKVARSPVEKCEVPLDPNEEKRKRANAIKDSGNSLVKLGDYEGAILKYTAAIEVFPEDAVFYSNRALCYLRLERYNECIEDCDQAIEIDKLLVKAYYRRMQANESLGNNMDALKDCTSALMIEPKNKEAKTSLDRINERLRTTVRKPIGPNFTELRENMMDILAFDKPPYKRSTKPLRRVAINEVILPKAESGNMKISDDDIDRLFNSNCGPFVEVKKDTAKRAKLQDTTKAAELKVKREEDDMKGHSKLPKDKKTLESLLKETEKAAVEKKDPKECVKSSKEVPAMKTSPVKPPYEAVWSETPLEPLTFDTMNKLKGEEKAQAKGGVKEAKEIVLKADDLPLPAVPQRATEFYVHWKELTMPQKYQYFKRIPLKNLLYILGAAFDFPTLGDIITILHDHYLPTKDRLTLKTLAVVSEHSELRILSMMLSNQEIRAIKEIVNAFKATDPQTADLILMNFQITEM